MTGEVFPLWPLHLLDAAGSLLTVLFTALSMRLAARIYYRDRENIIWVYLYWLTAAFLFFSLSRGVGHFVHYALVLAGYMNIWRVLEPVSASLNTLSFVFAGTITLFFLAVSRTYEKMVAARHQLELANKELAGLNSELESIASERSLNLMALRVADRVRNPATVIGAIVLRLFNTPDLPGPIQEKLREIQGASSRLDHIVKEYEEILKSKESLFRSEDLNEIIREIALSFTEQAAKKGITVKLELDENPLSFYAVRHLIRIALVHIVRNAIEVSPKGGGITLKTWREDRKVAVSVNDEGTGIQEKELEKVFDLFYSTKGRLGTGLPIVKQIVEEHGGAIRVASAQGKGATFTLTFPAGWLEFAASPFQKGGSPGEPAAKGL
ncbi:MAG: HAMP domain-containing sensor histidine kinase [Nitrospiraceae bacterium]|nr:HAMP domain-containing sensor histidine kinase [Nitrospiraceae bacterium]